MICSCCEIDDYAVLPAERPLRLESDSLSDGLSCDCWPTSSRRRAPHLLNFVSALGGDLTQTGQDRPANRETGDTTVDITCGKHWTSIDLRLYICAKSSDFLGRELVTLHIFPATPRTLLFSPWTSSRTKPHTMSCRPFTKMDEQGDIDDFYHPESRLSNYIPGVYSPSRCLAFRGRNNDVRRPLPRHPHLRLRRISDVTSQHQRQLLP